ncbi:hypothetical protein VNI00_011415 [Paramarasmius palmivorus]|uniref:GP-PDE domain-containing protein n=1 Tax=Paramarasmius palmivorus TaxID=297713 RepID=A0AAW0CC69_9AGAR
MTSSPTELPECWGHRGASAAFPENTLASFERAIHDGAEGIESDIHLSADNVILMFHDPDLSRTIGVKGYIKDLPWYGPEGMEHLRTKKEPRQPIPTFAETVAFLMQVSAIPFPYLPALNPCKPGNRHVSFNVDVKPHSDAKQIFTLMSEIITAQPDWQTELAPRILLGLWHPSYLPVAKSILPYCRRSYLGVSVSIARRYFWDDCDTFSIVMPALSNREGQQFIAECKKNGKRIMVWTVNDPNRMVEACRWGVDVILTDVTKTWLDLRETLQADFPLVSAKYSRRFLWTSPFFWTPIIILLHYISDWYFTRVVGPWETKEETKA